MITAAPIVAQGAALSIERYAVPTGYRVPVQDGVCMVVREGFIVDGLLVLDGILRVEPR